MNKEVKFSFPKNIVMKVKSYWIAIKYLYKGKKFLDKLKKKK